MAIEFNCPYCSAAIRVPDTAGGKQGKCPACSSRLMVPRVSAASPAAEAPAGGRGAKSKSPRGRAEAAPEPAFPGPMFPGPSEPEPAPVEEPPLFAEAPAPSVAAPQGIAAPAPISPDELPFVETNRTNIARAVKRRRRKSRGMGWIWMPILFGLMIVSGGLFYQMQQKPKLEGQLTAQAMPIDFAPPPQYALPRPDDVEEETIKAAIHALLNNSETLISDRMKVRFRGDEKQGMEITVEAAEKMQFVEFSPLQDPTLAKYCAEHLHAFNQQREKALYASLQSFFKAQAAAGAEGQSLAELTTYRDALGLPALTGGVGYCVEAAANNILYRCVFETGDGKLYFLLPSDATSFGLRGRTLPDGTRPFQGQYTVAIKAAPSAPAPPAESEPAPESKPEPNGDPEKEGLPEKPSKSMEGAVRLFGPEFPGDSGAFAHLSAAYALHSTF